MFSMLNIKFLTSFIEIFAQCDENQERSHQCQIIDLRQDVKNRWKVEKKKVDSNDG